jgi:hypothetical protein
MSDFPYYREGTHDQGVVTPTSGNAARTSAVSAAEGSLKLEVSDRIFLLQPVAHPFVTLLTSIGKSWDGQTFKGSSLKKKVVESTEFQWLEDHYGGRYCKVSGTYSTGAVTITVTGAGTNSAYIFTVGDVVKNQRTGECMLVATIASGSTITVASGGRAFGTTVAAAGVDGDELFIIGNVNEENGGARNVNSVRKERLSNYTLK